MLTDDEEIVWRNLMRLAFGLPRVLADDIQRASGVTWAQFSVLMHLSQSDDLQLRMSDLAWRVELSPSRISRVVDELITDGLVERRACPGDRRSIVAALTEAGSVTLQDAWPHYLRIVRFLAFDHLTAAETQAFGLVLERLVQALEAESEVAQSRGRPGDSARDFPGGNELLGQPEWTHDLRPSSCPLIPRPCDRSPAHPTERGAAGDRLPAEPDRDRHVDGPRPSDWTTSCPSRGGEGLRPAGRAVHSQRRQRTGTDPPGAPGGPSDESEIDRTADQLVGERAFRRAVEATGRRKLIMTALWTEVCLTFPALDALREGYEVYPVVDAVGGTSLGGAPSRTRTDRPGRRPARSAGSRWPASCSGTGHEPRRCPTSSTSS